MEEYIVIEHRQKGNNDAPNGEVSNNQKVFIIKAVNSKLPSLVVFSSSTDLQFGTKINVDDKKVYLEDKQIGEVSNVLSSSDVVVNTDYDIKYTGGYSKDGKIIYLDKDLPKSIKINDKEVDLVQSIGLHHELPEKWLIDDAYDYQYAHLIATGIEKDYITSLGIKWEDYDNELGKLLRQIYNKKPKKSPKNLDLSPYIATNDQEALKEIRESMELDQTS